MRRILEESAGNQSRRVSMPIPIKGWNARDPLPFMKKTDAIILDNFFPRYASLELRKGWQAYATLPADTSPTVHNVQTLMSYSSPGGTETLFACAEDGIYNVTGGGTVTTPAIAATTARWQYVNMTTAGGHFLWCCSGVDNALLYNGTSWTTLTGTSTPAITGVSTNSIINVDIFKKMLIFTVVNSLSFYFLPVNSIAGAASEYPLGSLFHLGGYLMATGSWTLDAGEGIDDYFVAITSKGEVAVYKGTNPADAAAWALVGVYRIAAPIGRRCFCRVGGDLYIITVLGLFPLSKVLASADITSGLAASDRIALAWLDAVKTGKDLFGWQTTLFPENTMLLVNIPTSYNASLNITYSDQFVMNTETGAWAKFTEQYADCWCVHNRELFFAVHNNVRRAWIGALNGTTAINGRIQTAFMKLLSSSQEHIELIKPIAISSSEVAVQLGIDVDYEITTYTSAVAAAIPEGDFWGVGIWDTAIWVGDVFLNKWKTVSHKPGTTVSLRLNLNAENVIFKLDAIEVLVQPYSALL